ncbi:SEC-C domain-containing protein [Solidesulfovibrio magneticus]|uniref:SEC-C motif domain protein n=1 Tax=Solidesulfovibrio magneticus (strain ATCC 700980 / DSM 13731 / RS-1) TaxID=573370 RepID=C4XM08_SOLM1|nr:SEC-C domain-containing protein [Solidesulfovibrio magneticus]BAH77136.1 hypothetical protein DMR_36450 [Solidesulfovibrio magneticus RS-1]
MANDMNSLESIFSEKIIFDAVKAIVRTKDKDAYLKWLSENIKHYLPEDFDFTDDERQSLNEVATVLGRIIWNATPLPWNKFRPQPLPTPGRNEKCFCGSGKKYKQCCGDSINKLPQIDPQIIWPILVSVIPSKELKEALLNSPIPINAILVVADRYVKDGLPQKTISLLQPFFKDEIKGHGEEFDYALHLLCNAYDDLDKYRSKHNLLKKIVETAPRSPLRSSAWQRLAAIRIDKGDTAGAWEAFKNAMKDSPDSVDLSHLELQLLAVEGKWSQVQERANFWLKKFKNLPKEAQVDYAELVDLIKHAATNPKEALATLSIESGNDPSHVLHDWIADVTGRPVPEYQLDKDIASNIHDDDEEHLIQKFSSKLQMMGLSKDELEKTAKRLIGELKASSNPDVESSDGDNHAENNYEYSIKTPEIILNLEKKWENVFSLDKPFGTNNKSFSSEDPWEPSIAKEWLLFLGKNPAAFDSLAILDDIATALFSNDYFNDESFLKKMILPILDRSFAIVNNIKLEDKETLPWGFMGNRPALRSLARLVTVSSMLDKDKRLEKVVDIYLRLNPNDNHGMRMFKINGLLIRNNNEEAFIFSRNYPEDFDLNILLGRALALFRLGNIENASEAVKASIEVCPKCIHYLAAKNIKQPKLSPGLISIRGADAAWFYRFAMRDAWLETNGAMEWLQKNFGNPKKEKARQPEQLKLV